MRRYCRHNPARVPRIAKIVEDRAISPGSCPWEWCRSGEVVAVSGGIGRVRQAVTADNLTSGSSLMGAMVSSDMYLAR